VDRAHGHESDKPSSTSVDAVNHHQNAFGLFDGGPVDAAFELLKWRSQESNIKLRLLAERLMSQFQSLRYDKAPPRRSTFDHILMTVEQRVVNA